MTSIRAELRQAIATLYKGPIQAGLEYYGLHNDGLKAELVERAAQAFLDGAIKSLVGFLDSVGALKKDVEDVCCALCIDDRGTKAELLLRIKRWEKQKLTPLRTSSRTGRPSVSQPKTVSEADPTDTDDEARKDESLSFKYEPDKKARGKLYHFQEECLKALVRTTSQAPAGSRHLVQVATGGGKTRIANDWLWNHVLEEEQRVLWVTKDWELLRQAASDLCVRYKKAPEIIGRIGGAARLRELKQKRNVQLVYTTIQSWNGKRNDHPVLKNIDVVVIDEVHWGESQKMYRSLIRRYRSSAIFIGLTATPRPWTDFSLVGRAYDFHALQKETPPVLARPIVLEPVRTGAKWSASLSSSHGDYTSNALSELARSEERNQKILKTYREHQAVLGKCLVFACDIPHAVRLKDLFEQEGLVSVDCVHSDMTWEQRRTVINNFRTQEGASVSRTGVLVNVEMLTHGVDIPDIDSVLLCRPTASPTLFWQMIGRASRLVRNKDDSLKKAEFRIIDFVDNIPRHADSDQALRAWDELANSRQEASVRPSGSKPRPEQRQRHEYKPAKILRYPGIHPYSELAGLEYQREQTFGIEFEFTRTGFDGNKPRDWGAVSKKILGRLRDVLGGEFVRDQPLPEYGQGRDYRVWNVEYDGTCGWEVVSRILGGEQGLEEVADALSGLEPLLKELDLTVSFRTGTHIHLAWDATPENLSRLVDIVTYFEPALMTLVSPSRHSNEYCHPLRTEFANLKKLNTLAGWERALKPHEMRYYTVNLRNVFSGTGTIEVRLHNGTQETRKILVWLSLWMKILELAGSRRTIPEGKTSLAALPFCEGPEGDIAKLATLVSAGVELRQALLERRAFVIENSWAV